MRHLINFTVAMATALFFMGLNASMAASQVALQPATDPNKPITIAGYTRDLTITLAGNPTTGYLWFLSDYNSGIIQPVEYHFYPSKSQLVGAPGMSVWRFKVNANAFNVPQITTISFRYARPWQIDKQDMKKEFTVVLKK